MKKITFLLQHNNSDRQSRTLPQSLGQTLEHTRTTELDNTGHGSPPEGSQEALFHPRPFFLFHRVPLFYLLQELQFSCKGAMTSKYSHSSQNTILNPRNHPSCFIKSWKVFLVKHFALIFFQIKLSLDMKLLFILCTKTDCHFLILSP